MTQLLDGPIVSFPYKIIPERRHLHRRQKDSRLAPAIRWRSAVLFILVATLLTVVATLPRQLGTYDSPSLHVMSAVQAAYHWHGFHRTAITNHPQ